MIEVRGFAATSATTPLVPFTFQRRDPGAHDVRIEILYSGVCHSDLHQAKGDWGNSVFPMVPGRSSTFASVVYWFARSTARIPFLPTA